MLLEGVEIRLSVAYESSTTSFLLTGVPVTGVGPAFTLGSSTLFTLLAATAEEGDICVALGAPYRSSIIPDNGVTCWLEEGTSVRMGLVGVWGMMDS